MAKCRLCGKSVKDHIAICSDCASEILESAESKELCSCGKPGVYLKHGNWLCEDCFNLHRNCTAMAINALRKKAAGIA